MQEPGAGTPEERVRYTSCGVRLLVAEDGALRGGVVLDAHGRTVARFRSWDELVNAMRAYVRNVAEG